MAAGEACWACRDVPKPWNEIIRLKPYCPAVAGLVCDLKYRRWWELAQPLGFRLGNLLRAELGGALARNAVMTAIPMPPLRRWQRGLDHADLLGRAAAAAAGNRLVPVLKRWWGATQASRARSDRLAASAKGWSAYRGAETRVAGTHVIIVDDVFTTGRTLELATRFLLDLGARRVTVAVIAVADPDRDRQESR
jgi:predicted amidophosphoribosyltransferase